MAAVVKRTVVSFYDDQMTHHAAALTYYALMSLFPTLLLGLSLLGLIGQYPETYDAIMGYVRDVAPASVVTPLDSSLQRALQNKGTAATAVAISVAVAFYGTTGVLEAARRALNVVFEIENGRGFFRRKLIDVASTLVLGTLVLVTGILVFVGGGFADDLLGFIGLGPAAADVWNLARWPAALLVAMLVFSYLYFITPDVKQRSWRWMTPARWWACCSGWSPRGGSRRTSPTWATWARSTGRSPGRSSWWPGSGSATSRCSSAPSSTPRSSARRSCTRACRTTPRSTGLPAAADPRSRPNLSHRLSWICRVPVCRVGVG